MHCFSNMIVKFSTFATLNTSKLFWKEDFKHTGNFQEDGVSGSFSVQKISFRYSIQPYAILLFFLGFLYSSLPFFLSLQHWAIRNSCFLSVFRLFLSILTSFLHFFLSLQHWVICNSSVLLSLKWHFFIFFFCLFSFFLSSFFLFFSCLSFCF